MRSERSATSLRSVGVHASRARFVLAVAALALLSATADDAVAARGVALAVAAAPARDAEHALSAIGLDTAGSPELDYTLHCQGCHRADGSATPGAVPRLAGSVTRFLEFSGGREYLVRVPGVAQSTLDDEALARLLNWLLSRFDPTHVPSDFRPYTAAEIGALRQHPLIGPREIREALRGEDR